METKKKDLEIIYNLQWKNKSANGGDKANILGMYDIPATTLNWEVFKSYLLKNSGTVGDDVKVCYITDSNREFPIESQTDFQIALYAFRRKARMGDIVNLKLDRISDQPTHKNSRHSNDVETQYDEAQSFVSTCCNFDSPPDWFISYMTQFKKNLKEELTGTVSAIVSGVKPIVSQPACCYHTRKSKADNSKKVRKLPHPINDSLHETREIIRSLKIEGKLERKLEKLENKTKKIREKKLALFTKSSDCEAGPSTGGIRFDPLQESEREDDLLDMDATPTQIQNDIPRFVGGEVYSHRWEVCNSGKLPWNDETFLVYTWGSKELQPLRKTIPAPHLKPGGMGHISATLQIPSRSGLYECYFYFHHNGRRFGQWLGCQIVVENKEIFNGDESRFTMYSNLYKDLNESIPNDDYPRKSDIFIEGKDPSDFIRDISSRVDEVKLQEQIDNNSSSDSDNQSLISVTSSSKDLKEDYVVVPIPKCFQIDGLTIAVPGCPTGITTVAEDSAKKLENNEITPENFDDKNKTEESIQNSKESFFKIDDESSSNSSHKSDIVIVTLPENNEDTEEYAHVIVDGQKVSIPKKIIKAEYLQNAEQSKKSSLKMSRCSSEASRLQNYDSEDLIGRCSPDLSMAQSASKMEANNEFDSHCSAVGSCFSDVTYAAVRNQLESKFGPTITEDYFSSNAVAPPLNLSTHDRKADESADCLRDLLSSSRDPSDYRTFQNTEGTEHAVSDDYIADLLSRVSEKPIASATPEAVTGSTGVLETIHNPTAPEAAINVEPVPQEGAPPNQEGAFLESERRSSDPVQTVHILPETLVNGAVTVASTAIHTARSVFNRIVPQEQPGQWRNGRWVSSSPTTPREANLQALAEMGFWNRDLNASLLARYDDDLSRVVGELVQ